MRLLFLLLYLCLSLINISAGNIKDIFKIPNKIYHIKEVYDLKGDSLFLPEGVKLSFEGGYIKNGVIFSPEHSSVTVRGKAKSANSKYYGTFINAKGKQLTYRLDVIRRPFKFYQPFMLWSRVDDTVDAYRQNGCQGAFITFHLQNIYDGQTTDSVSLIKEDQLLFKDNDRDIVEKLIKPIIKNRINIVGLMFHCEKGWKDGAYGDKLSENYQKYILNKVSLLKKYFPQMKIIYISNEQPWFRGVFSGAKKQAYKSAWTKCLYGLTEKIHKEGLKTGFKYGGCEDAIASLNAMDKSLLKVVDYHSLNFYPYSGTKDKTDLYNKVSIRKYASQIDEIMDVIKKFHKNPTITITETGILPYRESLPQPWQYKERKTLDTEVVSINFKTLRKILVQTHYKVEFINTWFLSARTKVNNETVFSRVYNSMLK